MKNAVINKNDIVKKFAKKHGLPIIDIKTSESMTQTVDEAAHGKVERSIDIFDVNDIGKTPEDL